MFWKRIHHVEVEQRHCPRVFNLKQRKLPCLESLLLKIFSGDHMLFLTKILLNIFGGKRLSFPLLQRRGQHSPIPRI